MRECSDSRDECELCRWCIVTLISSYNYAGGVSAALDPGDWARGGHLTLLLLVSQSSQSPGLLPFKMIKLWYKVDLSV